MKTKTLIKITAATIVCFALSYVSSVIAGVDSFEALAARYDSDVKNLKAVKIERTFKAQDVQSLDIKTTSVDIKVFQNTGSDVQVRVHGSFAVKDNEIEALLESNLQNGTLSLAMENKEQKDKLFKLTTTKEAVLEVYLPKQIAVVAKTVSGDFDAENVTLNEIKFETVSGDFEGKKVQSPQVHVTSTSGEFEWSGVLPKLEFKTVSGDTKMKLENADPTLEIKSVSGDLEVSFSAAPQVQLNFDTTSGDVEIDKKWAQVAKGAKDLSMQIGNGKGLLKFESVSGDLKIK